MELSKSERALHMLTNLIDGLKDGSVSIPPGLLPIWLKSGGNCVTFLLSLDEPDRMLFYRMAGWPSFHQRRIMKGLLIFSGGVCCPVSMYNEQPMTSLYTIEEMEAVRGLMMLAITTH